MNRIAAALRALPVRVALVAIAALLGLASPGARAEERILSYDSSVTMRADGSLDVTEAIRVRAEGNQIRRGIYRDFPTRYKDRLGNRVNVDFELLGVTRDGRPEPFFTEKRANGVRINTGDDSLLPVPLETTYTIHYRTARQLGFFPDHDELYWNVNGLGWDFAIDALQATVTLPAPVPADKLRLSAYTGGYGSRASDAQAVVAAPGVAVFRGTHAFAPREGMTMVVEFPKGLVAAPTRAQRTSWFLRDNRGVLVALAGLLLLAGFYGFRWSQVGRDPQGGPIFPRYEAPAGYSPAEVRLLRRMSGDGLGFTADLVDMAVHGFLDIHAGAKGGGGLLGGNKDGGWRLVKRPGAPLDTLTPSQRALAARLFRDDDEIKLEVSEASRISGALSAHASAARTRMKPRYFVTNLGSLLAGIAFSCVVGIAAAILSGGNGLVIIVIIGVAKLALHIVFAHLLRAPTVAGRKLLDEIEGLAMYLGVAERDELHALRGPGGAMGAAGAAVPTLDAARYEALLPYAMALDVEQAWTRQFTQAVGAAAALQATPGWYHGPVGQPMHMANIGQSLGTALTQQISSSATPPGSSSGGGGGGGGFSGGGGGGGGGGGR